MLWDYVYIGSEIVRSAMEDVVGTWPTGKSKERGKIVLKKACRQSGETDKPRGAHPPKMTNASNPLEWKRQGEWGIF
jgi:hypothetical protein